MALANSLTLIKNNAIMFALCRFPLQHTSPSDYFECLGVYPALHGDKQQTISSLCCLKNHWQHPHARQSLDSFLIRLVPGQTCVIN